MRVCDRCKKPLDSKDTNTICTRGYLLFNEVYQPIAELCDDCLEATELFMKGAENENRDISNEQV